MRTLLRCLAMMALLCVTAHAQFGPQWSGENPPRNGACFYNGSEYRGMYFCVGAGDAYSELPNHFRKKISSVRLRGSARVQMFSEAGFGGQSFSSDQNIPDLSKVPVESGTGKTWKKRVISLRVAYDPNRQRPARRPAQAMTDRPRQGACFFAEADFKGKSICLQTGESIEQFPPGFDNAVVSVRVFGHSDVVVYEEPGFSGASEHFWSSVRDLSARELSGEPLKDWAKRISSAEVR